jgi:hypothetical protein
VSERFVRGWKVSIPKLYGLVGAKRLAPRAVLASKASSGCREDVVMTLGDGEEDEGTEIAEAALAEILDGPLDRERRTDEYARVGELILNHAARPLGNTDDTHIVMQLTYHVPNDSNARWNPILTALRLPKLARVWGAENLSFPWKRTGGHYWPLWTVFAPGKLAGLATELKALTKQRVWALPADVLVDREEDLDDCRAELWAGLSRLGKWIAIAQAPEKTERIACGKTANSLVLVMDGDQ